MDFFPLFSNSSIKNVSIKIRNFLLLLLKPVAKLQLISVGGCVPVLELQLFTFPEKIKGPDSLWSCHLCHHFQQCKEGVTCNQATTGAFYTLFALV